MSAGTATRVNAPPAEGPASDPPPPARSGIRARISGTAVAIAVTLVVWIILRLALGGRWTLDIGRSELTPLHVALNNLNDWVGENRNSSPIFLYFFNYLQLGVEAIGTFFTQLFSRTEIGLGLPQIGWLGTTVLLAFVAYAIGNVRVAVLTLVGLLIIVSQGLWAESMDTFALVIAAVLLALIIGLPLGLWAGVNPRVNKIITPILDFMQILPSFAYLAPLVLLFMIGPAPAIVATARSKDPDEVFAPAAEAIAAVLGSYAANDSLRVGISSAGPIDGPAGTISPVNIAAWRHFPVSQRVAAVIGDQFGLEADVALAGDGHCFALGEHWLGAGRDVDSMVGLVLSTGVGGGAVLHNRLLAGTTGNAVHLGHISINAWGPECVCGCHGCVELYARGPALVAAAQLRGWTGDDAKALTSAAREGHEIAASVIDFGMRALAAGIASTATQLDVTTFVLGGGVSKAGDVIFAPLRRHLRDFATLDYVADLEVRPATLENAGLLGAAALALSRESSN